MSRNARSRRYKLRRARSLAEVAAVLRALSRRERLQPLLLLAHEGMQAHREYRGGTK